MSAIRKARIGGVEYTLHQISGAQLRFSAIGKPGKPVGIVTRGLKVLGIHNESSNSIEPIRINLWNNRLVGFDENKARVEHILNELNRGKKHGEKRFYHEE
jgi:hypothetical protein